MSTWDQDVSRLSGTEAVPGAILSQLLLPLGMKQQLSEQQENTSGREGDPPSRTALIQAQAFISAQFLTLPNQSKVFYH